MDNFDIGEYVIIDSKNFGKIINKVWSDKGLIIKLDNDNTFIDKIIKQYNLLDENNIAGHILVCDINKIKKINYDDVSRIINDSIYTKNINWDIILKKISDNYKKLENQSGGYIVENESKVKNSNQNQNLNTNNEYRISKFYINNMINKLFISNHTIIYREFFSDNLESMNEKLREIQNLENNDLSDVDAEDVDDDAEEELEQITMVKGAIKEFLEKFESPNQNYFYEFKNTLVYRTLIVDNVMDLVSIGKEMITKIKSYIYEKQSKIVYDDGSKLLEDTNLFDYLKFEITDSGYIEITKLEKNTQTINKKLIPDLQILESEYKKPINHKYLTDIILQNNSSFEINSNSKIINESLKILSQEYIICFQPKVEFLYWVIIRLLLCWYSDSSLNKDIVKIKILINLYLARGDNEVNKNIGTLPIITISTKYGKEIATRVLSKLSYYFFSYKKLGFEESYPTYFNKIDNLVYYTNGSLELKRYVRHLLQFNNKIPVTLSDNFTKIKDPENDNNIEYYVNR